MIGTVCLEQVIECFLSVPYRTDGEMQLLDGLDGDLLVDGVVFDDKHMGLLAFRFGQFRHLVEGGSVGGGCGERKGRGVSPGSAGSCMLEGRGCWGRAVAFGASTGNRGVGLESVRYWLKINQRVRRALVMGFVERYPERRFRP